MKALYNRVFTCLFLFAFCQFFVGTKSLVGQSILSDVSIKKELVLKGKWDFYGLVASRTLHESPSWQRYHLGLNTRFYANEFWDLLGGIDNFYRESDGLDNFYELRPWTGFGLQVPVGNRFQFVQRFIGEVRQFSYLEGDMNDETTVRSRYRSILYYNIKINAEDARSWRIGIGTEWFFANEQAVGERLRSLQRRLIRLERGFKNEASLRLSYHNEVFSNFEETKTNDAHTISLRYTF